MTEKRIRIVPTVNEDWSIVLADNVVLISLCSKENAISMARKIAIHSENTLVIYRKDGSIQSVDTYPVLEYW